MSEKMLTFEEWWFGRNINCPNDIGSIAEQAWVASRQGMVPADDPMIVDLRNVEWPRIYTKAMVCFVKDDSQYTGIRIHLLIDRPAPAWTPEEGDICAFWDTDTAPFPGVYMFKEMDRDGRVTYGGAWWNSCALIESVEEIGKPTSYFIERGKVWRSGK